MTLGGHLNLRSHRSKGKYAGKSFTNAPNGDRKVAPVAPLQLQTLYAIDNSKLPLHQASDRGENNFCEYTTMRQVSNKNTEKAVNRDQIMALAATNNLFVCLDENISQTERSHILPEEERL